jgi:hypothetical protein
MRFNYLRNMLFGALLLSQPALAVDHCPAAGVVEQHCGFPAPEDIDVMPNGKDLLFSAFGGIDGEHPQAFHIYNPETGTAKPIVYLQEKEAVRWDNNLCDSPATQILGSHGVHISKRSDGHWQLLAVNHSRESVEMYAIIDSQLAWRGCVTFPPLANLNDVTAIPSGGFLVTHMMDRRPELSLAEAMSTPGDPGFVWRWLPDNGLDKLPGSESAIPNGIAISADGQHVFIAATAAQQVKKIAYHSGELLGTVPAASADNFSWTPDGKLLITGINGAMPPECMSSMAACMAPFQVTAIDPLSLASQLIWQQTGLPAGAGTVAVEHQGYLYMGSFRGNQVLKVPLSALKKPDTK